LNGINIIINKTGSQEKSFFFEKILITLEFLESSPTGQRPAVIEIKPYQAKQRLILPD
jgi:hypothetical protein